jgi:DNA-binding winged helix-turn-helix (wHTH) protein/Tol biopolymer transport system component
MRFIFQEFIVDSYLYSLTKNGLKQEIEPRVFELLIYLCQHPNVPVSREELIEHVWQQRIVGFAAINRAISELRKVLEKDPSKPEIIKTISKVGYQFTISPVVENQDVNEYITKKSKATLVAQDEPSSDLTSAYESPKNDKKESSSKLPIYLVAFIFLAIVSLFLISSKQEAQIPSNFSERPLTSLKGTAFKATLSASGENLLFIHKNNANSVAKVWLQNNKKAPFQLTNDSYYYTFAIFGDKNQIIATRFNNLHERKCEIVIIDVLTFITTPIFECSQRALTILAYDRKRNTLYLNYRTEVNSPFSIYAYQISTSRLQQITFAYSEGNIRGDYMFTLSPTKDRLAVLEYQNNSTSLLKVINITNKNIDYHEQEFAVGSTLSWLNNKLVISDGKGISLYHLVDKNLNRLTSNTNIGFSSANSLTESIVFDKGNMIANIYQYEINNESSEPNEKPVTYSSFLNYQPQFANLSDKRAYISTNDGNISIIIQPEHGLPYKADFNNEIKRIANFHWSPDDNYLIATINSQLHLFNEKNKQWQALLPDQKNIHYGHFSNTSNIIFSSDITGDWQIWSLDIDSNKSTQLTKNGGYSAQGNIDNGYLYLTKFNHAGLYQINLNTGEEQALISDFKITSWKKWQVRTGTIYYETQKSINALNLKNKNIEVVLPHNGRAPTSFSVSFNKQYIQREVIEESNANIWQIYTKSNSKLM